MSSDLEREIAHLNKEIDRAKASISKMKRMTSGLEKRNQAKLQESEADLKKLSAQAPSADRDAKIYLATLTQVGARTSLEMCEAMQPLLSPDLKTAVKGLRTETGRLDLLGAVARFVGLERSIVKYRLRLNQVKDAIAAAQNEAANPKTPTGPLPQGTPGASAPGPAGANRPGLPGRPGLPARPGAPGAAAPGARPGGLPQPSTGRLPQQAARPGMAPGGAPGQPRPQPGTGPLAQRAAAHAAQRGGTGPLAQRAGTGQLTNTLTKALQEHLGNPEVRRTLDIAISQFQEIDDLMSVLRGDEVGVLPMASAQAEQHMNAVAGKIYYLKRTLATLVPGLREALAFDEGGEGADSLENFLSNMAANGNEAEPEEAPKPVARTSVMDQLRSIMKSK